MSHHMQRELSNLEEAILRECADVEKRLQLATQSVMERNADLAKKVIEADIEIDNMEVDIEEECLKILALYQPVAIDLRIIVSMLKINNDLERIGDLAVNIAERAVFLANERPYPEEFDFSSMGETVSSMLKNSVDALVNTDEDLAAYICSQDDGVDDKNRENYERAEQMVSSGEGNMKILIHLLSISRNYERIADHATNIAQDVIYMIKGDIVRHSSTEIS